MSRTRRGSPGDIGASKPTPTGRNVPPTLTEAFRRAVLRLFVKRELMDPETGQRMLAWPNSGFHVHDAVRADDDDKAFTLRLVDALDAERVRFYRLIKP